MADKTKNLYTLGNLPKLHELMEDYFSRIEDIKNDKDDNRVITVNYELNGKKVEKTGILKEFEKYEYIVIKIGPYEEKISFLGHNEAIEKIEKITKNRKTHRELLYKNDVVIKTGFNFNNDGIIKEFKRLFYGEEALK